MRYADGFVIPIPKKNIEAYRKIARLAGKVWMEHGALEYKECVIEDPNMKMALPFPKLASVKRGETIVFSWILYSSRAHRDRVNAKVMKDPRMAKMMVDNGPVFDHTRMSFGGFDVFVDL